MYKPIVVIDYGMGNIGSVVNIFKKMGRGSLPITVSSNPKDIALASKLVLPGVGHFGRAMENLMKFDLKSVLFSKVVTESTPILGICLGMQLFSQGSEEGGSEGLGFFSGRTIYFQKTAAELSLPHMGWNWVFPQKEDAAIVNLPLPSRFYFVHSYHVKCDNASDILFMSKYGYDFPAAISKQNILGVQFHPEKSHKFGMKLIQNFIENY